MQGKNKEKTTGQIKHCDNKLEQAKDEIIVKSNVRKEQRQNN